MTVEEIFQNLAAHMIKGVMTHEQFANYYDFLNLEGYKRCHEYHMMKEMCDYRSLCRYYINHYNKLIRDIPIENPHVIPENWYNYTRKEVDAGTKRNAVSTALNAWVNWETETKKLYEQAFKDLMELGEVAGACKIKEYIQDVDCELKKATRYLLNKETTQYDINSIVSEQKRKHHKYKKKMETELKVYLC